MAYNIIELNEKLTTELRALAKEMGIRRPDAYKKKSYLQNPRRASYRRDKNLSTNPNPKTTMGKNLKTRTILQNSKQNLHRAHQTKIKAYSRSNG